MQRALNIELLRIVCMLFIVIGHIGGRGGVGFPFGLNLMPHHVDCFILISGYFLVTAKFKFERILRVFVETCFYTFIITLLLYFFDLANTWDLIKSTFPFGPTKFNYWFVTKYLALMLLAPFIQKLCLSLTKRGYECLLLSLLLIASTLFSVFPFGELFGNGFSLLWMITMFVTGGYLRQYEPKFRYWGGVMLALLIIYNLCVHFACGVIKLHYNSLITYALAISTFMWFKNMRISGSGIFAKIITFISPNVFAIYLIHEHGMLCTTYLVELFKKFVGIMPNTIYLLLFGCVVMLVSVLVDKVRVKMFDILKLKECIQQLGKRIDSYYKEVFTSE